jgi:hypothetical protein
LKTVTQGSQKCLKFMTKLKDELKSTSIGSLPTEDESQGGMVGPLTKKERAEKIKIYLIKKERRKWQRRINYHSRKRVADTRPRFKGRFVSVT